jgi:hypothetical protein
MVKEIKNEVEKDIDENENSVINYRYMPVEHDTDEAKDIEGPIAPAEATNHSDLEDIPKIQASPPLRPEIVVDDQAAQES